MASWCYLPLLLKELIVDIMMCAIDVIALSRDSRSPDVMSVPRDLSGDLSPTQESEGWKGAPRGRQNSETEKKRPDSHPIHNGDGFG